MKKSKEEYSLQGSMLYAHCLPEWRSAIEQNKENRRIKKGRQVFKEGDPVKGVFFICSGKIKIHQRWGDGKELIIRFAKDSDMLGYRGLGKTGIYPVTATALENTSLCFINASFFETTLKVNHKLTYELMNFYAAELQETEKRMRNMAHMEVKGRVAETLLTLKKKFGATRQGFINIVVAKRDIAAYAGTTYETFSRVTNELIKSKLIKIKGRNIAILKEEKLKTLTGVPETG